MLLTDESMVKEVFVVKGKRNLRFNTSINQKEIYK
jgi:hypothetical protein